LATQQCPPLVCRHCGSLAVLQRPDPGRQFRPKNQTPFSNFKCHWRQSRRDSKGTENFSVHTWLGYKMTLTNHLCLLCNSSHF